MQMFGVPINPEDIPEPFRTALMQQKARFERNQMAMEDQTNRIFGFMDDLSLEDKVTLTQILEACESEKMAYYFQGYLTSAIREAGVCAGCGKHHLLGDETHGAKSETEEQEDHTNPSEEPPLMPDESESLEEAEQADALFDLYEVRELPDGKVQCNNCNTHVWPSLTDRMMKDPGMGGCPTCIQNTKWGG